MWLALIKLHIDNCFLGYLIRHQSGTAINIGYCQTLGAMETSVSVCNLHLKAIGPLGSSGTRRCIKFTNLSF